MRSTYDAGSDGGNKFFGKPPGASDKGRRRWRRRQSSRAHSPPKQSHREQTSAQEPEGGTQPVEQGLLALISDGLREVRELYGNPLARAVYFHSLQGRFYESLPVPKQP